MISSLINIDIRKQEEILNESYMMIPDSSSRYEKSIEDLETEVVSEFRL